MKLIFMGTPDFAVPSLNSLVAEGHDVRLVVTMPDRPKGRSGKPYPPPVKMAALSLGLAVYQPEKISRDEVIEKLLKLGPDAIVVAAYGGILPKKILDAPPLGAMNIHASLLPKYRGAAPIPWALLDGEDKTGVTIIRMEPTVDTGDILLQEEIDISDDDDRQILTKKLSLLGAKLIVETLRKIEKNELEPLKQDEKLATFTRKLKKEDFVIDWHSVARKIWNQIRALSPEPGARTEYMGKILKIFRAKPIDAEPRFESGRVESASPQSFLISTKRGLLKILELQLEGKKRMKSGEFLLGHQVKPGDKLG